MTSITVSALVLCPCQCGEAVSLDLGTFADTSAELGACSKAKAEGIHSYTVRKSAALAYERAY